MKSSSTRSSDTDVAEQHRKVQREQDAKDREKAGGSGDPAKKAMQAGRDAQPTNPLPEQHLEKPGVEAEMALQPRFLAPDYRGSGKLQGMAALVTGGDSGIGRAVAVLYARE